VYVGRRRNVYKDMREIVRVQDCCLGCLTAPQFLGCGPHIETEHLEQNLGIPLPASTLGRLVRAGLRLGQNYSRSQAHLRISGQF
jgi:hypothetical protein